MSSILDAVSLQEVKDLVNIGSTYRINYTEYSFPHSPQRIFNGIIEGVENMMRGITLIVKEPGDRYPKYIPVQWITDIEEEPSGPPILKGGRRRKSSKRRRRSCKRRRKGRKSYRRH